MSKADEKYLSFFLYPLVPSPKIYITIKKPGTVINESNISFMILIYQKKQYFTNWKFVTKKSKFF